eukprot:720516_1
MVLSATSAACLTSNDKILFVLGGFYSETSLRTVGILNISENTWMYSYMQTSRHYHSCVVDPVRNELWAIGGVNKKNSYNSVYLKSVERISIENVTHNSWEYTQDLMQQVHYTTAVLYRNVILIVGGSSAADRLYSNKVQVIDCVSGNVTLGGYLNYAVYGAATILVDNRLFMFGGAANSGEGFQKWQYLDLPTQIPTASPSYNASNTMNETNNSTSIKTTHYSRTSVTKYSTASPINDHSSQIYQATHSRQDLEKIFHVFFVSFASFVIIISLIGYIHSKYIHQNDFFRISLMFTAALQTADMFSDCFFTWNLSTHMNDSYLIITVISIFLIVMPAIISIGQLWCHLSSHWAKCNRINIWIVQYGKYLYLLSFISGSSFTAVSLFNCNFCSLSIFSMGLTKTEMTYFSTKRLRSTIIIQNVPQIGMQIWYLMKTGNVTSYITISSIVFSLVSIIVTVLSLLDNKKIIISQSCIKVTMDIIGEYDPDKCSTKTSKIKQYFINKVFGDNFVELLMPRKIRNGLQISVQLYIIGNEKNHYTMRDYHSFLNEVILNNELPALIQNAWNMNGVPSIQHITVVKSISKYSQTSLQTQRLIDGDEDHDEDFVYWPMDEMN